jgi:hypothetical protein
MPSQGSQAGAAATSDGGAGGGRQLQSVSMAPAAAPRGDRRSPATWCHWVCALQPPLKTPGPVPSPPRSRRRTSPQFSSFLPGLTMPAGTHHAAAAAASELGDLTDREVEQAYVQAEEERLQVGARDTWCCSAWGKAVWDA